MTQSDGEIDIPQAVLRPERRVSWLWVLPGLVLILALALGVDMEELGFETNAVDPRPLLAEKGVV